MTQVIAINVSNDMYIDSTNNIALASGVEAIAQAAKTATLAQLGEMIFFQTQGMPARQAVFVGSPNYALYQAALVAAITAINGVVAVSSLVLSVNGGTLNYTAEIETIFGSTVLNG